jgi:hypothetical protein
MVVDLPALEGRLVALVVAGVEFGVAKKRLPAAMVFKACACLGLGFFREFFKVGSELLKAPDSILRHG